MGQFKPMVKMMTTEPSIELKLKKGGSVKKMQMGGLTDVPSAAAPAPALPPAPPARGGMPSPGMPPGRPSLMARRRAMRGMPAGAGPAAPVGAASRMMKEGGESKSEHKAEMAKMGKLEKELKSHEGKPASKGHKGLKTGGVVNGQGGFKAGGIIKSEKGETKMVTTKPDHSPAKTGDVKLGNGGGYATGGVAKANGGGYKKGGAAKKHFATGGKVDSGRPVAMPQGRKTPSAPVSISRLSGTFKKGGEVAKMTPAERKLNANYQAENASNVKAAKADTNEKYSKYSDMKMAAGGKPDPYDQFYKDMEAENIADREAILNIPKKIYRGVKSLFGSSQPKPTGEAVTKTKESVTVSPAKKRGGAVATC